MIVNFFGGPGYGKSTCAAYVFAQLKIMGVSCELVTEFAREKVWENALDCFKNQAYVFGEQSFRITRCCEKVRVVITDSPLAQIVMYNPGTMGLDETFNRTVLSHFKSFHNLNYLMKRMHAYKKEGRYQDEDEAVVVHESIRSLLREREIPYREITSDYDGYQEVLSDILAELRKEDAAR
ncbi:MAG: AAA family ATPase [Desulfovibrionaceae bacterium]|nr:AAA family ATPase [Desulfovibrionaceae bacterium]